MRADRPRVLRSGPVVLAAVVASMLAPSGASAAPPAGGQLAQSSQTPSMSADGTRVAFVSTAPNLVPGDEGISADVFVKILRTGAVVRASAAADGTGADGDSSDPSLSADGTKVAFVSTAANLVPGDTNGTRDVFVKDLTTGAVVRASERADGSQVELGAKEPSLSADGTKVAFVSAAPDLIDTGLLGTGLFGSDTNGQADVFVKDLTTGAIERVSTGEQAGGPALSGDGGRVAFWQYDAPAAGVRDATRDVYVADLRTGELTVGSTPADGSVANGESSEPSLSADGAVLAFTSFASNLVPGDSNGTGDVFVKDLRSGAVRLVSRGLRGAPADFTSELPSVSADGTRVAFMSYASNLVPGDTNAAEDVFVTTLRTGATVRASTSARGRQIGSSSYHPSLSASGTLVAFASAASTLVAGDTNGVLDVFVKNLGSGAVLRVSTRAPVRAR